MKSRRKNYIHNIIKHLPPLHICFHFGSVSQTQWEHLILAWQDILRLVIVTSRPMTWKYYTKERHLYWNWSPHMCQAPWRPTSPNEVQGGGYWEYDSSIIFDYSQPHITCHEGWTQSSPTQGGKIKRHECREWSLIQE